MQVLDNSPQSGYISWSSVNISYKGQTYQIADNNTNLVYVYWKYADPTSFYGSNTYPTLGPDDILVFVNKMGTHLTVPNTTILDGSLLVPESVVANAIAANTITGDKIAANTISAANIVANTISSTEIAADAIGTSELAASAVQADNLAAGSVTANALAANSVTANALAANSVTAAKIAANTITANQIAANTIGAAQIAANAITADKMMIGDFENLAGDDPGFENGGVGWSLSGTVDTLSAPHGGTKALHMVGSGAIKDTVLTEGIPVQGGDQFYAEVWIKTTSTGLSGTVQLAANLTGSGMSTSYPAFSSVSASTITSTWTKLSGTITIPAGYTSFQPRLSIRNDVPSGDFYFDDVIVRRMTAGSLIVDGTITAGKLVAGTITATSGVIGSLDASKITTGTLDASKITVANLSASVITTGTLDASKATITNINASNISSGYIAAARIQVGSLDASVLKVGSITAASGVVGSLDAGKITTGTLDASLITVKNLSASAINSGSLTAINIVGGQFQSSDAATNMIITGGNIKLTQSSGTYLQMSPNSFIGYTPNGSGGYNTSFRVDSTMVTSSAFGTTVANVYLGAQSGGEARIVDMNGIPGDGSVSSYTYLPVRADGFYGNYVDITTGVNLYIRPYSNGEVRITNTGSTTSYRPLKASNLTADSLDVLTTTSGNNLYVRAASSGEVRATVTGSTTSYVPLRGSNLFGDSVAVNSTSTGTNMYVQSATSGEVRCTVINVPGSYVPLRASNLYADSLDTNSTSNGTNLYIRATSAGEIRATVNGGTGTYIPVRASSFPTGSLAEYKTDISEWTDSVWEMTKTTTLYQYKLKLDVQNGLDKIRYGFVIGGGFKTPPDMLMDPTGEGVEQYLINAATFKFNQEAANRIEALEQQNQDLMLKVANLEQRISKLEAA
jgi:hypothetical protein